MSNKARRSDRREMEIPLLVEGGSGLARKAAGRLSECTAEWQSHPLNVAGVIHEITLEYIRYIAYFLEQPDFSVPRKVAALRTLRSFARSQLSSIQKLIHVDRGPSNLKLHVASHSAGRSKLWHQSRAPSGRYEGRSPHVPAVSRAVATGSVSVKASVKLFNFQR